MHTETEAKALVQRYVSAVAAGDAPTARELFAPAATWTLAAGDLPIAGTWEGRDAIIDGFLGTAQSYYSPGSISIEVTGIVAEGGTVVVQLDQPRPHTLGPPVRERLHRRVHGLRRVHPARPRVHGHALRARCRLRG
jgi:ketosteroid isomerase-like protein